MRYGEEQEIKSVTTYKTYDDSNIDGKEQVRDLGIMMRITASFTLHIRNIVKKARDKIGCLLRVFQSREFSPMLALETSGHFLTRMLLPALAALEGKILTSCRSYSTTFKHKIPEAQHLNYWERMQELKFHSFQRRNERYIIIYIWKLTQHMVQIFWYNGTQNRNQKTSKTWNTQCVIQYPANRNPA